MAELNDYPILAVASGKGGVGKSTVSLELALALRRRGAEVGLLDADIYGPSLPMMVNLRRRMPVDQLTVWRTPRLRQRVEPLSWLGCKMMSAGFLIGEDQAMGQPAQIIELMVMRLLTQVNWGKLDLLIIDMPPGTGDLQQQVIANARGLSALMVVTPQDLAHADARRMADFLRAARVPIVGGLTNMSHIACPCCGEMIPMWREPPADQTLWSRGVRELVRIPFFAPVADQLASVSRAHDAKETPASRAFDELAATLCDLLGGGATTTEPAQPD
jgi:ATP-binding protein involved in chromosome partitioning